MWQIRAMVAAAVPQLDSAKQRTALFAVGLVISLSTTEFDSVHLHVEYESPIPTTAVSWAATSTASVTTILWPGYMAGR